MMREDHLPCLLGLVEHWGHLYSLQLLLLLLGVEKHQGCLSGQAETEVSIQEYKWVGGSAPLSHLLAKVARATGG